MMIRIFLKSFTWGFVLCFLITYILGWYDLVNNGWLTGNWFTDFYKSITYYFGWVLVYWWVFILIGSLSIGLISTVIFVIIRSFKK